MFEAPTEGTLTSLQEWGSGRPSDGRAHTVNWPCGGPQQIISTGLPPAYHTRCILEMYIKQFGTH